MNLHAAPPEKQQLFRRTMTAIAAVALLFSLFIVAELLVIGQERILTRPIDHPLLVALRGDLTQDPGATAIEEEIRREERVLREAFLTSDQRLQRGAWLLLFGLLTFVAATKLALSTRRRLPAVLQRGISYDPDHEPALLGRASVIGVTGLLAAAAVIVPFSRERGAELESARGVWARFRGAGGLGVSSHLDVPLTFDARAETEQNLRWKTVVPLPGLSSPVVWNDRVFLTGGTENTREVYCLDALSGAILWRRGVSAGPESSEIPENIWEETGYAAPTPVTDGQYVWAMFANGDVICLDAFGKERWCVNLGVPSNMYGLSASPMLVGTSLVLQVDQDWGSDGPASALYALEAATGELRWRVPREVESSWPSPIPVPVEDRVQILACANPYAIAYDPASGEELWRVDCLEGDGGPSPSYADGLVYAVNVSSPLTAIRPDGKGDVTKTHVAWTWDGMLPDVCSVLAGGGLVWILSTDGTFSCIDAGSGATVWEEELEASFYTSPVRAGGRIYLFGRRGQLFVVGAGREYQLLATGHLGEPCDSSPALVQGRIYVRGSRHLFCFQEVSR